MRYTGNNLRIILNMGGGHVYYYNHFLSLLSWSTERHAESACRSVAQDNNGRIYFVKRTFKINQ